MTAIEPLGSAFTPLRRVGRVESAPDVVVVMVETGTETEFILVNLEPGSTRRVQLPNGKYAAFDGLALRVRDESLALAGGTFAEGSGRLASMRNVTGSIQESVRDPSPRAAGWFLTSTSFEDEGPVAGRTLIVEHGDGTRRAWTLDSIESVPGGTRLLVREEPGFVVDPGDGTARYYQFPQVVVRGPHRYFLARIARREP